MVILSGSVLSRWAIPHAEREGGIWWESCYWELFSDSSFFR